MSIKRSLFYNVVSSIFSFIGMVAGVLLGEIEYASLWINSFTAGSFLYIALSDLVIFLPNIFLILLLKIFLKNYNIFLDSGNESRRRWKFWNMEYCSSVAWYISRRCSYVYHSALWRRARKFTFMKQMFFFFGKSLTVILMYQHFRLIQNFDFFNAIKIKSRDLN